MHLYGVDSLVAVELRSWFAEETQAEIAVFDMMGNATMKSIGHLAVKRNKLRKDL